MFEIEDVLKFTNIYLALKDTKSRYLYCNEKYAEFLNLDSPKQIIGKYDSNFFQDDLVKLYLSGDRHVLQGGSFCNIQEPIIYNNKKMKILISKNQVFKKNEASYGVVLSFLELNPLHYKQPDDLFKYQPEDKCYKFLKGDKSIYFTSREYSIIQSLFLGLSAKQIAHRLNLSTRTIEDYVQKIKNKLNCSHKHNIINTIMLYADIS